MQTTMLSVQNCKFETSFFYLCDLIPPFQRSSRNKSCTYEPFCRTVSFENPFYLHCVKSVQLRSYFWSVFSCIRREYGDLRSKSPGNLRIQSEYRKIQTRNNSVIGHFSRSDAIKQWNKLSLENRNTELHASFQEMLRNLIRPTGNRTYKIYNPLGMKLLTSNYQPGFSDLSEHKLRYNFADTLIRYVLVLQKLNLHFICYTLTKLQYKVEPLWLK